MNIETDLVFYPGNVLKEISPIILFYGSKELKNSRKLEKYGVSLREIFGLCVIDVLRNFLEPEKNWIFSTEPKLLADDGVVASIDANNKINYYEKIEQVYLPGNFLERNYVFSMNDHIFNNVIRLKDRGVEYKKDTSLFILSDIRSMNYNDTFEWQDFVKKLFNKNSFLHLYFLSLVNHNPEFNEYYLLSFTDQKHRQRLNGEFKFKLSTGGIFDFKCTQKINLLGDKKY